MKEGYPHQADVIRESQSCLSPMDGREALFTSDLRPYLSEEALHRYRARVEIDALIALSESGFPNIPSMTSGEKTEARGLLNVDVFKPMAVAEYDHLGRNGVGPLEHDVKAGEVYLGELMDQKGLSHLKDALHFGVTSEDINNIAWNEMLRDAINNVLLPKVLATMDILAELSDKYAETPVVGRTHEQTASPTTFGKRFSYFLGNMMDVLEEMEKIRLTGKLSGAVGNYNATTAVAPDFDYQEFARKFVKQRGMEFVKNANQRNSHIAVARLLEEIKLFNIVEHDLANHMKDSLMMGLLDLTDDPDHVGSSVMPHKINPWRTEVGEGYLEESSRLIDGAIEGLVESRLERDASDHPWERAYGDILGRSLVGINYILQDFKNVIVNKDVASQELQRLFKVLAEAIQTAGRMEGTPDIYMRIKELTRGKELDREGFEAIVGTYIKDPQLKARLLEITPTTYVGQASKITRDTVGRYRDFRRRIEKGILDEAKSIDAILFDFDGTLNFGDKEELIARLTSISSNMNLDFTEEEIREFGNRSDWREMRTLMVTAYNRKTADKTITETQFQAANDAVSGEFDGKFRLGEDAKEMLKALKTSGKKIGIVTTRGKKSLERLLKSYGIGDMVDVIVSRDDIDRRKPHPESIIIALDKLGIPQESRHRVLYVGDHREEDIIAGNAAGVRTALISTTLPDHHDAKPYYIFSGLREVKTFFER